MATEEDAYAEEMKRKMQILNEYVKQMAYKPTKPPVASDRTEYLAQMRKRNIIGTYDQHKDDMEPKERTERVERLVAKHKALTTEQLEDFIQHHRRKQAKSEQERKQQQILYHETLAKLQKQCEDQLMNAIMTKFATEIAKRSISHSPTSVETENYQRLQKSLICNMFMSLKVSNEQQAQYYPIYNKLAAVLADLILQALFLAQDTNKTGVCAEKETPPKEWPENTEKDRCIKLRALRAAKKKLNHRRQKCSRFSGSVCF